MQRDMTSLDDFEDKHRASECMWILKEIKGITYRFEGQRNILISLDDARTTFHNIRQGADETISDYHEHFRTLVEVLEHYGGTIGESADLIPTIRSFDPVKRTKLARDHTLAIAFLLRADCRRFGALLIDLSNQFSRGNDQYPVNLTAAYSLLVTFAGPHGAPSAAPTAPPRDIPGMTFVQSSAAEPVTGTDGVTHPQITCFRCNDLGHYAHLCPSSESTSTGVQLLQHSTAPPSTPSPEDDAEVALVSQFTFAQNRHTLIPSTWILLDSQSTVSVFFKTQPTSPTFARARTRSKFTPTAASKLLHSSATSPILVASGTTLTPLPTSCPLQPCESSAALPWTPPTNPPSVFTADAVQS